MPGKHAPDSPRSYYVSLARALGAALGALALMVVAVVILLSRGGDDDKQAGSPAIQSPRATVSRSSSPRPSRSPSASPSTSPTSSTLAKNKITVDVLNGTNRQGLARKTMNQITAEGYRAGRTGNAEPLAKSTIFYRRGARDEALLFQKDFPDFTVLRESSSIGSAVLRVVLGSDYP
jgi:hypothetical protein